VEKSIHCTMKNEENRERHTNRRGLSFRSAGASGPRAEEKGVVESGRLQRKVFLFMRSFVWDTDNGEGCSEGVPRGEMKKGKRMEAEKKKRR